MRFTSKNSTINSNRFLVPPAALVTMIFPWAEDELSAYNNRIKDHGPKATDYALKNFLMLLIELRVILLQDAAVLFVKHPGLSIWKYPPFNTPEFSAFSCTSTLLLAEAELRARQNLEALPQTISMSMKGILASISIQRDQDRSAMEQRFDSMEGMMLTDSLRTRKKTRKFGKIGAILIGKFIYIQADQMISTAASNSSSRRSSSSQVQQKQDLSSTANFTTSDSASSVPIHGIIPIYTELATILPRGSSPGPMTDIANDDPRALLYHHFRLSSAEDEKIRQVQLIDALQDKFGDERLFRHQFEWVAYSSGPIRDEYLPLYTYKSGISVRDIWTEWSDGLDGQLSITQLNDQWGSRWRRNIQGLKTEASRRKHIIDLIVRLSKKTNWDTQLALKFLEDKYSIPGPGFRASATAFCRHLQNKKTHESILADIMTKSNLYR